MFEILNDKEIVSKMEQIPEDESYSDYAKQLGINIQDGINFIRFGAFIQRNATLKEVIDRLYSIYMTSESGEDEQIQLMNFESELKKIVESK